MVDFAPTAVETVDAVTPDQLDVGAAVSELDLLYLKAADNLYYPASADEGTEEAKVTHISLSTTAGAGKVAALPLTSEIELKFTGVTFTVGSDGMVALSANAAGKMAPFADLATGNKFTKIGFPTSSSNLLARVDSTDIDEP